jgi:hypothetical protein
VVPRLAQTSRVRQSASRPNPDKKEKCHETNSHYSRTCSTSGSPVADKFLWRQSGCFTAQQPRIRDDLPGVECKMVAVGNLDVVG